MKSKPCKVCGSTWHTAWFHNKPKRLKRESDKTKAKRLSTTEAWFEANPPDKDGFWYCYISKHPLCPKKLTRDTIRLEHDQSKARAPELKHDISNIYPACDWDNEAKGSLSAAEYMLK